MVGIQMGKGLGTDVLDAARAKGDEATAKPTKMWDFQMSEGDNNAHLSTKYRGGVTTITEVWHFGK